MSKLLKNKVCISVSQHNEILLRKEQKHQEECNKCKMNCVICKVDIEKKRQEKIKEILEWCRNEAWQKGTFDDMCFIKEFLPKPKEK